MTSSLLTHMGICGLLTQLASSEIVVGACREKLTNHHVYAVFNTPGSFSCYGNRTLGTVPVDSPLLPEAHHLRRTALESDEIEVEKGYLC